MQKTYKYNPLYSVSNKWIKWAGSIEHQWAPQWCRKGDSWEIWRIQISDEIRLKIVTHCWALQPVNGLVITSFSQIYAWMLLGKLLSPSIPFIKCVNLCGLKYYMSTNNVLIIAVEDFNIFTGPLCNSESLCYLYLTHHFSVDAANSTGKHWRVL